MADECSYKKCSKCTYKPLSDFHRSARNKDGRRSTCKACDLEYSRTEPAKASNARYAKTETSKRARSAFAKTAAGKLIRIKGTAKYVAANTIKIKAHHSINNAIRDGKITKPSVCEECSETKKIHGHHDDYALPLKVRWLCQPCHFAWHKENGPGING